MSRSLLLSIGLFGALTASGHAWAQAPATPRGPTPVPEGGVPVSPASGGEETGRAPPPRALPAEEPAVLRPSAAGTPGAPTGPSAPTASSGAPNAAPGAPRDAAAAEPVDAAPLDATPLDAAPLGQPADSGPPAAPVQAAEEPSFSWQPFGYLRAQLVAVRQDDDVAFVGRSDGFSLQNARLGVRGALGERVRFELSLDGAVDEREQVNTPNGRLRVGLRDAFVDVRELSPAWLPVALDVRVGRFEAWFDPDGYAGDTERQFVDRALESHGVSATEGWETRGLPPGRSIGVALQGQLWPRRDGGQDDEHGGERDDDRDDDRDGGARLLVEAAVMNGAGEFASANDNDSVAVSAALRLVVPERAWLQAAVRHNPRTEGDLPFQQEEVDSAGALGGGARLGPVQLAGGGVLQYTKFSTTGGPRQRAWGAHGQAMVQVFGGAQSFDVGYRFAVLDPSSLVVSDRLMEHTVGFVAALPALRARLQGNLTHAVEQEARQLTNDRMELLLEVRL